MRSTIEGLASATAFRRGVVIRACVLTLLGLLPHALYAQGGLAVGLRAGVGVDRTGDAVFGGQIELTEFDGSNSVQVAVTGFSAGLVQDRRVDLSSDPSFGHVYVDHHEETAVRGIGLVGSFLFRHSREARGPYFMVGLGVGPLLVDWRLESPTDGTLGSPLPGGGSFKAEEGITLGSMVSLGFGQRLHEHFDLRAQMLTLIVPPSDLREDLKVMPAFTLTTGVSF